MVIIIVFTVDLINTYQHQIEKGASSVTVQNFYEDYEEVTIPLNPLLTASQNVYVFCNIKNQEMQ